MKGPRRKPFVISRQSNRKNTESASRKSQMENNNTKALVPIVKKNEELEEQNRILSVKTAFKNCYNLFQVSPNLMSDLIQKYAKDNVHYREEGFTQQADRFLSKIASGKKIPRELRNDYPLYDILISISKIFMLNEYEIVVLGCALDHCGWKIQETVYEEEAQFLKEFPGNFGEEISSEEKRLMIYLLVITFSLKQYLNEKSLSDKIHAYCESICTNFQAIFNRWTRLSLAQKFNYSPMEINRKFRMLCEPEAIEIQATNTDYDAIVDNIMGLSGSYKSKITTVPAPTLAIPEEKTVEAPAKPSAVSLFSSAAPVLPSILFPPIDTKHIFANLPVISMETAKAPKIKFPDISSLTKENFELPEMEQLSRRSSSSNMLEEFGKKMRRLNNGFSRMTSMNRESSLLKEFALFTGNNLKNAEAEDFFMNLAPMPTLSKKSSHLSQILEDQPDLFRFKSNLSSWYKE